MVSGTGVYCLDCFRFYKYCSPIPHQSDHIENGVPIKPVPKGTGRKTKIETGAFMNERNVMWGFLYNLILL